MFVIKKYVKKYQKNIMKKYVIKIGGLYSLRNKKLVGWDKVVIKIKESLVCTFWGTKNGWLVQSCY